MQDLAELLKAERLRQGWTLQDLSNRTHVSITVLKALEAGRFERIGTPVVIDSLLRTYSIVLGINAKTPGAEGGPQVSDTQIDPESLRRSKKVGSWKWAVIVFLACCGMAVAVRALLMSGWKGEAGIQSQSTQTATSEKQAVESEGTAPPAGIEESKQTEAPEQAVESERTAPPAGIEGSKQPEAPEKAQSSVEVSEAEKENSNPPSENSSPNPPGQANLALSEPSVTRPLKTNHVLEIQSDQKTWVQVIVDEGNAESELLQPVEMREWQPMERARVVIGNGGGVRVKWDGKPVEISAKPGRVVRLTFPLP